MCEVVEGINKTFGHAACMIKLTCGTLQSPSYGATSQHFTSLQATSYTWHYPNGRPRYVTRITILFNTEKMLLQYIKLFFCIYNVSLLYL